MDRVLFKHLLCNDAAIPFAQFGPGALLFGGGMKAYINYPNPHFTLHWNDACPHIQKHHKQSQRVVRITPTSIEAALSRFIAREFTFAPRPEENDMWLDVSLASPRHDEAVVFVVQSILGSRYAPLATASIESHACPTPST
jgi:hypothetical protein